MRKRIEIQNPQKVHEEVSLVAFKRDKGELIKAISALEIQAKSIKKAEEEMKKAMVSAMEEYGIKSFSIGDGDEKVTFSYVSSTTEHRIDSALLKEKYPQIAEECTKEVKKSAYVSATVGERKKKNE